MNVKDILDSRDITPNDITNYQMKCVVNKYMEERTSNPKKKVSQIASEMGVSVSTLNRYKKTLGFESSRKHRELSPTTKREIVIKSFKTKALNKAFKEELKELNDKKLSGHDYANELDNLSSKFKQQSIEKSDVLTNVNKKISKEGRKKVTEVVTKGAAANHDSEAEELERLEKNSSFLPNK